VVLKNYVKEHWQEGEGRFMPPQTSDEEVRFGHFANAGSQAPNDEQPVWSV
jgi:hypothetical protein